VQRHVVILKCAAQIAAEQLIRSQGGACKGDARQTQKENAVTFSKTLPPLPVMSALPDEQLIELLLHLQVRLPYHLIVETSLIGAA
jgi:hypothetical protein